MDNLRSTHIPILAGLVTALLGYLGGRAGRSWTPPAGVEWRLVERTGETGATAWSSSSGLLVPGRHLQLRATAPSGAGQSTTHNLVMGDSTWAWTIQT